MNTKKIDVTVGLASTEYLTKTGRATANPAPSLEGPRIARAPLIDLLYSIGVKPSEERIAALEQMALAGILANADNARAMLRALAATKRLPEALFLTKNFDSERVPIAKHAPMLRAISSGNFAFAKSAEILFDALKSAIIGLPQPLNPNTPYAKRQLEFNQKAEEVLGKLNALIEQAEAKLPLVIENILQSEKPENFMDSPKTVSSSYVSDLNISNASGFVLDSPSPKSEDVQVRPSPEISFREKQETDAFFYEDENEDDFGFLTPKKSVVNNPEEATRNAIVKSKALINETSSTGEIHNISQKPATENLNLDFESSKNLEELEKTGKLGSENLKTQSDVLIPLENIENIENIGNVENKEVRETFFSVSSTPALLPENFNLENINDFISNILAALRITERVAPRPQLLLREYASFSAAQQGELYLQLPIAMGAQVYNAAFFIKPNEGGAGTKKAGAAKSAIIALNTANMGRFEVFAATRGNACSLTFRVNEKTRDLVRSKIHLLGELLAQKGKSIESFSFAENNDGKPWNILSVVETTEENKSVFDVKA